MLHAWRLGFTHPLSGAPLAFEAPIPAEFAPFLPAASLLDAIRSTPPEDLPTLLG